MKKTARTGKDMGKTVKRAALVLLLLTSMSAGSSRQAPTPATQNQNLPVTAPTASTTAPVRVTPAPAVPAQQVAAAPPGESRVAIRILDDAADQAETAVRLPLRVPEYQDQLIDPEGPAEDPRIAWSAAYRKRGGLTDLSPGYLGLEYRYFRNELDGDVESEYQEHGVAATLRQDSVDWGKLEIILAGNHEEASWREDNETGAYARVHQSDFYLTDALRMDNRLGHIRPSTSRLLSVSPRQRLPQPTMAGAETRLTTENLSVSLAGGELGTLAGRTFPVFDDEARSGQLAGLSTQYKFNRDLEAGIQGWKMQDTLVGTEISEHTSVLGAVAWRHQPWKLGTELHVLSNDDGAKGIWADGSWRQDNGLGHQLGVYKYDVDLKWIDNNTQITNDRQGLYWEGTFTRSALGLHMGAEHYGTNLDDDPLLTTHQYTNIFSSLYYRLSRDTTVGGGLAYLGDEFETGDNSGNQNTWRVTGHASQKFFLGTSSARISYSSSTGDQTDRDILGAIYDHDWLTGSPAKLRTGVEYYLEEREAEENREQTSLRIFGSYPFQRIDTSAGVSVGISGTGATESGRSSSAFARVGWQISAAFQAALEYTYNHYTTRLLNNQEVLIDEQTAFLSLKYLTNWGQPRRVLGAKKAGGAGRIFGEVFLDKNQNGIREPDEPGVPAITVFLDQTYTVETDKDGYFEFWPVGAGEHVMTIDVSNVPLPWLLQDETPRKITVETRKDSNISFGLISPGSPVAGFENYGVN